MLLVGRQLVNRRIGAFLSFTTQSVRQSSARPPAPRIWEWVARSPVAARRCRCRCRYARRMANSPEERTGSCLCGSVTYTATGAFSEVLQCHCENCRRLSGNFIAATRSSTDNLQIDDSNEAFRWHELDYAKYGFCRDCGSTMFYRAADRPQITAIMVGGLNDAAGLTLGSVWFSEEAQPHNVVPDGVPLHIGNG